MAVGFRSALSLDVVLLQEPFSLGRIAVPDKYVVDDVDRSPVSTLFSRETRGVVQGCVAVCTIVSRC